MYEMQKKIEEFINYVDKKNPNEPEFLQSVKEVVESLLPFIVENPQYKDLKILERMIEPERVIMFRVPWVDKSGEVQINKGYRIEMNSAIGPYKGGLRFHPTVNLSILKFLAFEQVFKNALTTLPIGGGKGGSDFDPKGKTDEEVMRFCQSFMTELCRHIGPNTDVPAGDIGVGGREIGFLFGQYKRIRNEFTGILTGKGFNYGGSHIRPESTGYGCVFLAENALNHVNDSIKGKEVIVSGSGNVAQYATEQVNKLGGKVITLSDSSGFIYDKDGISEEKLAFVLDLKNNRRGRISEYAEKFGCEFFANEKPWAVQADLALPCATQNEIDIDDAKELVNNGCKLVSEGANMPTTIEATNELTKNNVIFLPGKAANAGGVATSALEMSQNSQRLSWTREEVEQKLKDIIFNIHENCVKHGQENGKVNYVKGANIAGFIKVADAMISQGVV